jgi:hypothetical protein
MKEEKNNIEEFEFRVDTIVDGLILEDIFRKIKTKEPFMVYHNKRYFRVSFVKSDLK